MIRGLGLFCIFVLAACQGSEDSAVSCEAGEFPGQVEFLTVPDSAEEEKLAGVRFRPDEAATLESIPWRTDEDDSPYVTVLLPYSPDCVATHRITEDRAMRAVFVQDSVCNFNLVLTEVDDEACNSI